MIYCYTARPALQDFTIIHSGEKIAGSVLPYVSSVYLYDYTCVLILFVLCNFRSFSLCGCLCFATGTVIYALGSGFNLDVNPCPLVL